MNQYRKYIYMLGLSLMALASACSQDEEVTTINYDRLFSPIKLEASIVNQIGARLTWTPTSGASSYKIELFEDDNLTFTGTPVTTLEGITASQIPYLLTGLDGETQYSARVQAVGEGIESSKWSAVAFKTDAEQLFKHFTDDDLTATSATLSWEKGKKVTSIVLIPGDKTHALTAAEVAAGKAVLTGLKAETAYTAQLLNGTKNCGRTMFTTLVDLTQCTVVEAGADVAAILRQVPAGSTVVLQPGTHRVEEGALVIASSIRLLGERSTQKPVLIGSHIQLADGASFSLRNIVLDGTGTQASGKNQAFVFTTKGAAYGNLLLEDCTVRNFTKGFYYLNVAATVESVVIQRCLLSRIECDGGDFLDSRKGAIKTITLANSTVYASCQERDFLRYDDKSADFEGVKPVITVDHCTLDGVSNTAGKRLMYVRFKGNSIRFTNNLVTNTVALFTNQANTALPVFENNNYYNAPDADKSNLTVDGNTTTVSQDKAASRENPQYKAPQEGDFTMKNAQLLEKNLGDPRWR